MDTLNLDQLFEIVEATPVLDQAEAVLRQAGYEVEADALVKLQQDAGIQIAYEMTPDDVEYTPPKLLAAYEPVTPARLSVLAQVHGQLQQESSKNGIESLMRNLNVSVPQSCSATHVSKLRP